MAFSFQTTTPSDNLSIEQAVRDLSPESIEALIDICEGWVDEEIYKDHGFCFEWGTEDDSPYPYTKETADELLSSGLITLHPVSVTGEWYVTVNADVINEVHAAEGLCVDNEIPEI